MIFDGQKLASHSYWCLPELPEDLGSSHPSEQERLEGLDSLLTQAVSDRLVSDVPLGALLEAKRA